MSVKAIGITACIDRFNHKYIFIPNDRIADFLSDSGYLILNGKPIEPSMIVWDNGRESYASVYWSADIRTGSYKRWTVTTLPGNPKIEVVNAGKTFTAF